MKKENNVRALRRSSVVVGVVLALGASVVVPTQAAESAHRDSRADFFEQFPSLKEFASANGRDPRAWDPSTGVSKRSWASTLDDESVRVDSRGRALVVEPLLAERTSEVTSPQSATPVTDIPTSDAFLLNSLPGSNRTIYLDFTGHSLAGTYWQVRDTYYDPSDDYTNEQMQMPAYDVDGNPATFSTAERQVIIETWSAVAEDYAPFDVNVTTQDPGEAAILRSNSSDTVFGVRALITDTSNVIGSTCGCQGVAYLDVFDIPSDNTYYGPALNFVNPGFNGKTISDIVSHEVGHNLGLSHDGTTTQGYYAGRDGWAPIMGVGYYEPLVQFSNGSYTSANQTQDDFVVMSGNGISLRTDDHGDTRGAATPLTIDSVEEGVITTRTDIDYFKFTATAATHEIRITSPSLSSNLDVEAQLLDSSGTVIATSNPNFVRVDGDVAAGLDASFTASTTPGETYYVTVDGVGYGPGTTTGYTDYGSRGEYHIVFSLLTLTKGTVGVTGTGVFGTSLSGSTGTWTSGTSLSTEWYRDGVATGDTDSTYDIAASDVGSVMTFKVSGTKSGYTPASVTSAGVTITPATISMIGTPTVSGTGVFGTTLSGSTGSWMDSVLLSAEWYRNGSATGDTDSTYTILASDVGKTITYRVTGSKAGYTTATATSSGVTVTAATISPTATPTVSGTGAVGTTLTGSTGTTWLDGVSLTTSWLRNGSSAGDTDSSYTILPTDLGKTLVFRVVASKSGYTQVTATSSAVTVIAGTISPTAVPVVTGISKVGKTLKSNAGTWQAGVTLTRQWLRNGSPISNATEVTYKLKSTDKGKRISVRVTGSSLGYTTVSQTSAATGRIKR